MFNICLRSSIFNLYYFVINHHYRKKETVAPMPLDQEYVTTKNNVIKAERRLLKELGFCVHVKHPHKVKSCSNFSIG